MYRATIQRKEAWHFAADEHRKGHELDYGWNVGFGFVMTLTLMPLKGEEWFVHLTRKIQEYWNWEVRASSMTVDQEGWM